MANPWMSIKIHTPKNHLDTPDLHVSGLPAEAAVEHLVQWAKDLDIDNLTRPLPKPSETERGRFEAAIAASFRVSFVLAM